MRKWGVFHSLEEALQVLKADEVASIPEIQEAVTLFTNSRNPEKLKHDTGATCLHPLIVIEGLDGSGKTTVTKLLSKLLGGVKMSTPGPQFSQLRPYFDKQPNHLRRAFYSLSNYAAALEIKEMLKKQPVVLDRFWHSTAAYAVAGQVEDVAELPEKGDPIYKWPDDLKPYPDFVFFLTVSETQRMIRISGRKTAVTQEEDRLAQEANFRKMLIEAYRRFFNPQITEVNSTRPVKIVVNDIFETVTSKIKPQ